MKVRIPLKVVNCSYRIQQLTYKVVSLRFVRTAVSPYLGDSGCKTPLAWAISIPVSKIPRLELAQTGTRNGPGRGNSKFLNLERRQAKRVLFARGGCKGQSRWFATGKVFFSPFLYYIFSFHII